ncbi:MAG: cupin domain-containing protein [Rhodospirillaceae bacterium]|jgi:quercetin dioxygenase-like cupin family protein|nr:cupin domain-containing protein [Rhodospirillaceae bacterium]MBT7268588.1 cupin domain-containing protein [Rhodospirillaceae bacterium]
MTFFRFDGLEKGRMTPNLSSAEGPIIEGDYMYFCNVFKETGTGSELHYHPNELLIFPLEGKINAIVGKDRRIVEPGTFVHVPAYARHSMKATEDGPLSYLYIKDQTWSVVGVAADEAPPEEAISIEEINRQFEEGEVEDRKNQNVGPDSDESQAIIEGLGDCYYPILGSFDEPPRGARRIFRIEGERLAFEFADLSPGYMIDEYESAHEKFIYMMCGRMEATIGGETRNIGAGDIVQIGRGTTTKMTTGNDQPVRYAAVESLPFLEEKVDQIRTSTA